MTASTDQDAATSDIFRRYGIFIAFALILLVLSIASPDFRRPRNFANILRQSSVHGVMAVGMTFVILTAGIDLSVGSLLALAGVLCAGAAHAGAPPVVAIMAALGVGAVAGLLNGLVITKGRVTPFVVTLGMMSVARGLGHIYTDGRPISGFSDSMRWAGAGHILGIPVPVVVFVIVVLAAFVVLRRTTFGRYVYAIGSNETAARLTGLRVDAVKIAVYALCGLTAALGAVIEIARLNAAESIAGVGYELDVIASVVIGGTSLMGSRGGVIGTFVGALLIGTINNGMNLLEVSPYWQLVAKGAIIVAAALLDRLREH